MPVKPPVQTSASVTPVRQPVWDLPIRLFHWSLVLLIALSWWTGTQHEMEWHQRSGIAILVLLIFRLYWGIFGTRTARFVRFVRGPRVALSYLRTIGTAAYRPAPGHNPVGGWSVILMLAAMAAMVITGLFAVDVDGLESGPLADHISFDQGRVAAQLHEVIVNLLLGIVALHVLAIGVYQLYLRHDLIGPMVRGSRPAAENQAIDRLDASPWKVLIGISIAGLFGYAIAQGLWL